MKFRTTIILFVLVVAAGLWLTFHTGSQLSDSDFDAARRHVFPSHEYQAADSLVPRALHERAIHLELQREEGRITIRRARPEPNEFWRITMTESKPIETSADSAEVATVLSVLEDLEIERRVPDMAGRLDEYGLKNPKQSVTFATPEQSWTLNIGTATTDGGSVYVNRAEKPELIYVVRRYLLDVLGKDVAALRDKAVLPLGGRREESFELRAAGQVIVAHRVTKSGWDVVEPFRDRADFVRIASYIKAALGTPVAPEDFIDDAPRDLGEYGLAKPLVSLKLSVSGKQKALLIGRESDEHPGKYFAKRSDEPGVFLLPRQSFLLLNTLACQPQDLRVQVAVPLLPGDKLIGLGAALPGKRFSLVMDGARWKFDEADAVAPDQEETVGFLTRLMGLRVIRWIDKYDADLLKQAGLTAPVATITLSLEDGAKRVLRIGGKHEKSGLQYVRRGEGGPVLLVSSELFDKLIASGRLAFVSRVMLECDQADVTRLRITRGDEVINLQQRDGAWSLTSPVQGDANEGEIADLFVKLSYLEAQQIMAQNPADLALFDLNRPRMTVAIALQPPAGGRPVTRKLLIGKPFDDESVYAMIAKQRLVFLMSQVVVDRLNARFASDLVCSFNLRHATELEIHSGDTGPVLHFERADRDWVMTKPEQAAGQSRTVLAALNQLKDLRAESVCAYNKGNAEDAARFGLNSPVYIARIALGDDNVRELHLGRSEDGRRIATSRDTSYIFLVREAHLAAILKLAGRQSQGNKSTLGVER